MKKITEEEIRKLSPIYGRRKSSIRRICSKLELNEYLFVSNEEYNAFGYKNPYSLYMIMSRKAQSNTNNLFGKEFSVKKFKEGYVIKRTN